MLVEAFQMTKERRQDNSQWPAWLNEAWSKNIDQVGAVGPVTFPDSDGSDQLHIRTLEGLMTVSWNDYIIRGTKGELYACKPDIFEEIYDKID